MNEIATAQPTLSESEAITRHDLTESVRATAVLADLVVAMWSGERTDKKISAKLKEDAHAVGNTGRYVKNLLAGCDEKLKDVRAAYAAIRARHYQLTLPWVSDPRAERNTGSRLLPNLLFHRYVKEMGALQRIAEQKRDEFLADYPALITQAQANLAGMADAADYPSVAEVRAAFRIDLDFQPVPDAGGFSGLPDAMLTKLGERLKARQERSIAASQADMWDRAKTAVAHLVDRLEDPEARFKANTVEAVRELIGLLPGFNCAGDARVDAVVVDIRNMLDGITSDDIRKDDRVRLDVAIRAQAIADKLDAWGI